MNIRAAVLVVVLTVATLTVADDDYEYDDDVPAPAPVKPLRPSPLLRQARGPVIGRPGPKSTVTQKTTTEAPPLEYEDEELEDEVEAPEEELPNTTTEPPKKGGFKNGVVRPFRSNADLIEALKRRRQQHQSGSQSVSTTTTSAPPSTPEKTFKGGRRTSSNKISNSAVDQTVSNSERKSTVNGRKFNPRNSRVTEAPVEAEPNVEEVPSRSRTFGRGRRF